MVVICYVVVEATELKNTWREKDAAVYSSGAVRWSAKFARKHEPGIYVTEKWQTVQNVCRIME